MAGIKLAENHWYRFVREDGKIYVGQYIGRQKGFECCVCRKGTNAYTFNIWHTTEDGYGDYETWGFGKEHMPVMIEDLGMSETEIYN